MRLLYQGNSFKKLNFFFSQGVQMMSTRILVQLTCPPILWERLVIITNIILGELETQDWIGLVPNQVKAPTMGNQLLEQLQRGPRQIKEILDIKNLTCKSIFYSTKYCLKLFYTNIFHLMSAYTLQNTYKKVYHLNSECLVKKTFSKAFESNILVIY